MGRPHSLYFNRVMLVLLSVVSTLKFTAEVVLFFDLGLEQLAWKIILASMFIWVALGVAVWKMDHDNHEHGTGKLVFNICYTIFTLVVCALWYLRLRPKFLLGAAIIQSIVIVMALVVTYRLEWHTEVSPAEPSVDG